MFAICHRFPGWLAASGLAVLICVEASARPCDTTPGRSATGATPSAFQDPPPPPKVKFTDVTSSAGLSSIRGRADRVGSGCAFLDFDGDGDQDILLAHAAPAGADDGSSATATPALFANDGSGKFADVTRGSGLDVSFGGIGVAAGDYDNDGFCDVFFTGSGGNRLFRGKGAGRFEDVTSEAGLAGRPNPRTTSASWLDYNNDGFLDLFVAASGGEGLSLYKNEGKGRFTNVSRACGLRRHERGVPLCFSVVAGDLDEDGWIDLIAGNEGGPTLVFHNQRNGTFAEVGGACKLAYDAYGNPTQARGIDLAWCDDNDSITVAIGGKAGDMLRLFVGRGQPFRFSDETMREGIGGETRRYSRFGVAFLDYDLDGCQDLLTVSGESDGRDAAQPLQLFWNQGPQPDGGFQAVAADAASGDLFRPLNGRGVACGDIDGDGDLDLLITQSGRSPVLFRNDQQTGHRALRVRLVGSRSARDGIGARLVFSNAKRSWRTQVMPARGYLSQSELPITIGFRAQDSPEELEVRWPSGSLQKLRVKAGERSLTVIEPSKARLAGE